MDDAAPKKRKALPSRFGYCHAGAHMPAKPFIVTCAHCNQTNCRLHACTCSGATARRQRGSQPVVMLIGRITHFGEQPLPAHLRTMGKALEERAALSNDLHVQEIGVFLRLLANTLEDADVSGDDDEGANREAEERPAYSNSPWLARDRRGCDHVSLDTLHV